MDQRVMASVNHSSSRAKFKIHSAKPKRPRTAYNYFVREERIKILAEFEEKAKKDGISINQKRKKKKKTLVSFEEIGKIMGNRWKVLDESSRDKFVTMATEDFKRYQLEKEAYDKCRFLEVTATDECDPVEMKDGQGRPFENGSIYCEDQKIFAPSIDTLKRVDSTTIPVSSRPDIFESLNYSVRNPLERTVLSRCFLEKFPTEVYWSNNPYCLRNQNSWGARYPLLNDYSGSHWPVSTIPNYQVQNLISNGFSGSVSSMFQLAEKQQHQGFVNFDLSSSNIPVLNPNQIQSSSLERLKARIYQDLGQTL